MLGQDQYETSWKIFFLKHLIKPAQGAQIDFHPHQWCTSVCGDLHCTQPSMQTTFCMDMSRNKIGLLDG
jgi:hypothetical protein